MSQRGNALIEFSGLAIVLIVPVLWLILAVFDVQRASFALTTAARAAGRAYVMAPSDAEGRAAAAAAVNLAFEDQHDAGRVVSTTIRCTPLPRDCHSGTSVVTVELATKVALPWLPASWGLGTPVFALTAHHTVPVGQFQEIADAR